MSKLTQDLVALQNILRLGEAATPQQQAQSEALRAEIPAPILAHFLRRLAAGRSGIALVRNGVCGECHIRLAHSLVYMLGRANELLVCENCGAFVALAPEEQPVESPVTMPKPVRRARKPRAAAVVR